jgi:aryl-alcohol dehydrogenase-like predicted oxidoreductase
MKYRRLGGSGPQVSAVGLGRGSQPIRFGDPLEAEFNATVLRAVDLGVNFFDTSDAYWGSRHEELLGRALKAQRKQVLIASKFGNIDLPDGKKATNGHPKYVVECCEASLVRLNTDVIDIYYLHRVDPKVPIEETVGAMAQLISQGKVRFIGICEAGPRTVRRAHREHPLTVLQTEYSLWCRDVESQILAVCRELGVGYVAYAPLGRGLLTGAIKSVEDLPPGDRRRRHPRFLPENLARNVAMVEELESVAARYKSGPAQVALAWLLAQGEDIVPIPGTSHVRNLEQNVAAVELELADDDLRHLSEVFALDAGAGTRYPEHVLKGVGL